LPNGKRKTIDGKVKTYGVEDTRRIHLCSTMETWLAKERRKREKRTIGEEEKRFRDTGNPWLVERHQVFLKAIRTTKNWGWKTDAINTMEERRRLRKGNGEVEVRVK